jgi:hypothetical protein
VRKHKNKFKDKSVFRPLRWMIAHKHRVMEGKGGLLLPWTERGKNTQTVLGGQKQNDMDQSFPACFTAQARMTGLGMRECSVHSHLAVLTQHDLGDNTD